MTQFLPPNLLALFAPRDPIPFLPQLGKLPHEKHHNQPYCGIAPFIRHFEDPRDAPPPTRAETREERLERKTPASPQLPTQPSKRNSPNPQALSQKQMMEWTYPTASAFHLLPLPKMSFPPPLPLLTLKPHHHSPPLPPAGAAVRKRPPSWSASTVWRPAFPLRA
nr:Mdm2 protein [Danio rerio]